MNDHDNQSDTPEETGASTNLPNRSETGPPKARVRLSRWRGWIWAVPLAALMLVAFLVVRTWLIRGPTITVTFPHAKGISAKGTPVKHKGVKVGNVKSVYLAEDLDEVVVTISMKSSVSEYLRTGTRFWIVSPSLLSGSVSSLLSGAYIAMDPGPGEKTQQFEGMLRPPKTEPDEPGRAFVLYTDRAGGLHHGSPIFYHGLRAGQVTGVSFAQDRDRIRVNIFIHAPFAGRVLERTRFWRCGGIGLSSGGGGVGIDIPSLSKLLGGCIAFETPTSPFTGQNDSTADGAGDEGAEGERSEGGGEWAGRAKAGAVFRLYSSPHAARTAFTQDPAPFTVRFPGSIDGLRPGAPVELKGVRVGVVREVSLIYDAQQGRIATPVIIEIYPGPLGLASGASASPPPPEALYDAINRLVKRGLRAQLQAQNLLLGGKMVALVMTEQRAREGADAGKGRGLDFSYEPPRIPATGGGDISSVIASIGRITQTINELPIQAVVQNLKRLTARLQQLAGSPRISQTIEHLNRTLANLQQITGTIRGQIKPLLKNLRQTVKSLHSTARTLNRLTGGSLRGQQSIQELIGELIKAARSVRTLADYLTRHPAALIRGRTPE